MSRPIAIDLFSGVGGLSLGFEQAGFDVKAAVEIDPIHAAAHKYNFPECAVVPRSVEKLPAAEILRTAGIEGKRVDVVFGGPPCQGFSLIGHRAINDARNKLVKEFVRLVQELDASYFVFENVKGLTVGQSKEFLEQLIDIFGQVGYRVRTPWKVLNSAEFGVPQDRERLILLGVKEGLPVPEYPKPMTHMAGSKRDLGSLPQGPTAKDALGDLPDAELFDELLTSDVVEAKLHGKCSKYAREMRCATEDAWHFGYRREWDRSLLSASMRTDHSDISRRRFAETEPGSVEPISRFFKLSPDGVSNTLRAGTDSARGAFTSPRPIHFKYNRCITVREMARLHGFPDWFRFHETKWHGARQIGNAVPPPLARAIASSVIRALGIRPKAPARVLELTEDRLLRLGMAEAADLWKVPVPIQRRDRKSGARKRSQNEIEALRLASL